MASIPMDQAGRKGGGRPSVAAHPVFPAVVALWFAALFGIGSLIVPAPLIESVLAATGISAIIPAAAPPLGFTARSLIAVVATVLGALLGIWAARRVGQAHGRTKSVSAPRRLQDTDELGELDDDDDDFDTGPQFAEQPAAPAPVAGRRRALAMEEEDATSDFLHIAPLPGEKPLSAPVKAQEAAEFDPDIVPEDMPEDALELNEELVEEPAAPVEIRQQFVAPEPAARQPEPLPFSPPSLARAPDEEEPVEDTEDAAEAPRQMFQPIADDTQAEPTDTQPQGDDMPDHRPFDAPSPVEAEPHAVETPMQFHSEPQDFEPEADFAEFEETEADSEQPEEAPTGEGLVQLVQKLGSTLEKHREWSAQRLTAPPAMLEAAPQQPAAAPIPTAFEAAAPGDAAEAMKAFFGSNAEAPVQPEPAPASPLVDKLDAEGRVRPADSYTSFGGIGSVSDEEEDDEVEDIAATFSLPIGASAAPAPTPSPAPQQFATPTPRPSFDLPPVSERSYEPQEDEAETAEEVASDYAAISASNPFRSNREDFVRIEDEPQAEAGSVEPAVQFPNQQAPAARAFDPPADGERPARAQPAPSNDDSDRALREALLNLQRMGK